MGYLESILELGSPVQGTSAGGGGASFVHPVHPVGADKWVQTLSGFLDSLIECLGGRMASFPQDLVLGKEHALDATHETSTLTIQVTVDFLLKGRLVEISGADGDTESNGLLLGFASDILEDGKGRIDTATLFEETADSATGTLGGNEDDINVSGGDDTSEILVHNGETVRKVQCLRFNRLK